MNALRNIAVGILGVVVMIAMSAPAQAHCGKCAPDCKEIVKLMETGKSTITTMIAAAETASKGKAVGMTCKLDKGKVSAKVHCVVDGKVQAVEVDADGKTGSVEEVKNGFAGSLKAMETAKLTPAKIIEAGEAHAKGKALAWVTETTGAKATYEVYAVPPDGKIQKVKIDVEGKPTGMEVAKTLPDEVNKRIVRGG